VQYAIVYFAILLIMLIILFRMIQMLRRSLSN